MHSQRGFSLIDILISIALVGAMFAVFGAALSGSALRTGARLETRATALAEGALAAALSLAPSELTDRADAPLIGLTEKRGAWAVRSAAGAPSAPNAITVTTSSAAVTGVTAALRIPDRPLTNGTVSATVSVPALTPSGWRAGLLLRGRDLENGYRYSVGASDLRFERVTNGTATALYTLANGLAPGAWTTLAVTMTGTSFTLVRDGVTLTTVNDATRRDGDLALVAQGNAAPFFDDVSVTGDYALAENFDAAPVDGAPALWRAVGVADLPSGATTVTVDHPTVGGSLARVLIEVSWQSTRATETVTVTGYR